MALAQEAGSEDNKYRRSRCQLRPKPSIEGGVGYGFSQLMAAYIC